MNLSITEIASIFMVLFALIDVFGSVPIFLGYQSKGKILDPKKITLYSFVIFIVFLFVGEGILSLFGLDVTSFAVAGALVIFIISIEMIFGIEVFKNDAPAGASIFVPVVFPMITGPGTLTALLTMRADYSVANILIALFLNMVIVYFVLNHLSLVKRVIGENGVYVLRKIFGIILMAIAIKIFTSNMAFFGEI